MKNRCRLIHVHWAIPIGLIGAWLKSILGEPLLVTIHGSDLRLAVGKSRLTKSLFVHVCNKANHVNCVSEVQRGEIERLGIPDSKVSVLPMGVDEAILQAGKQREKKTRDRPFTILSNRNLLPIYNLPLLIRAIPKVLQDKTDTQFIIAGEGSQREYLEEEVGKLNLKGSVHFLGRVPHQEMPNLLAQADIFVSTSQHDGTSVSLLEAIGAGAFPIVTDIPANREWIRDGENGFLVPIDEEQFLARRIIEAMEDRELLEKSQKENFLLIQEKAYWPMNLGRVKDLYASLINFIN